MKKKYMIVGNWKMNKLIEESLGFIKKLAPEITDCDVDVLLAVPFTSIHPTSKAAEKTKIIIGAQNMNDARKGAFTGEIAGIMLEEAGAEFVILGHSERRQIFHETNDFINKKVERALQDDLMPILCIGETKEEKDKNKTEEVLKKQIKECLDKISKEDVENIKIAYEPIWAIGTGETATVVYAEKIHKFIREYLKELFGKKCADNIYILYGGSVTPENVSILLKQKDIDGVLVGGASLDLESFLEIIKNSVGV